MPTFVHVDIAADDPERARKFYEDLFEWKMEAPPGMTGYYLFETAGLKGEAGIGGGLAKRESAAQNITSYVGVDSIEDYIIKVEKIGGKIIQPKIAIPGWGYLAVCLDTENNMFGLWQDDADAK